MEFGSLIYPLFFWKLELYIHNFRFKHELDNSLSKAALLIYDLTKIYLTYRNYIM